MEPNSDQLFAKKINQLINETPSGELRNLYTDLNILHLSSLQNRDDKIEKINEIIRSK